MQRALAMAVLTLLTAACTLGPDPTKAPKTAADHARAYAEASPNAAPKTPPDTWWLTFADPVTVRLITEALANNTDIQAAAARVLAASATLTSARGARWPAADVSFSANRNKFSFVLPQVGRVGIYSTTFADQLAISYQVDLFGRLARARQAAWANLLATEADRRTVINSLIAQVIRTRSLIAALDRQLDLNRKMSQSWKQTLGVTERRYVSGVADPGQLYLVRSSAAAAQAAVLRLEQQRTTARHALDILVGRRPGSGSPLPRTLAPLPDLAPIPAGIPASLLDRRPDLVAARMRFAAATAQVGVALANLFPSLTLSAAGGMTASKLDELSRSNTVVYNAAFNLLAPLFHGGRLRAAVRLSRAQAQEAAARYAGAVLKAMGEVEDALAANRSLRRQLKAVADEDRAAHAADTLARRRYEHGTGELLDLLAADRARQQADLALTAVQADLWDARVGLYLALGGDWEAGARKETTRPSQGPPPSHHAGPHPRKPEE